MPSPQRSTSSRVRLLIYRLGFNPDYKGGFAVMLENAIGALIVANLIALWLEHVPAIYRGNEAAFQIFDAVSVAIFSVEYLVRLYVSPEDPAFKRHPFPRFAYAKSPFALIDLMAILPFYLAGVFKLDLRVLRVFRLLRLFKLFRLWVPAIREFRQMNRGRTMRQQIYALLNATETSGKLQQYIDTFIVWWVLLSVFAVVLESVQGVESVLGIEFVVFDSLAVLVFSIEYGLRIYSCVESPRYRGRLVGRFRYMKTPLAIIDLLAIIPFYLEALLHQFVDLRFLRIFRLMRLLKLTRYSEATGTLYKAMRREWPVIAAATFIMTLMVVLTASLGYLFEHAAQPDKFENIPQSIYWAVVTLASVGYGDISPVTPMGRLTTIIMALAGIGIFAVPAAILSAAFNDQLHKDREAMQKQLRQFLDDGVLDDAERSLIYAKARQMRISEEEVDTLIEQARQKRADLLAGSLPLEMISNRPELAVELFRHHVCQLRQIVTVVRAEDVEVLLADPARGAADERDIWQRLVAGAASRRAQGGPQPQGGNVDTDRVKLR